VRVRVPPVAAGVPRLRVGDRAAGHSGLADARLFDLRVSAIVRCVAHAATVVFAGRGISAATAPAAGVEVLPPVTAGGYRPGVPFGGEMCLSGGIACPEVLRRTLTRTVSCSMRS